MRAADTRRLPRQPPEGGFLADPWGTAGIFFGWRFGAVMSPASVFREAFRSVSPEERLRVSDALEKTFGTAEMAYSWPRSFATLLDGYRVRAAGSARNAQCVSNPGGLGKLRSTARQAHAQIRLHLLHLAVSGLRTIPPGG